tara:strand:+ start:1518 stop:1721 length:204 start_codon:yes stop_codon:yes gene_type:complete
MSDEIKENGKPNVAKAGYLKGSMPGAGSFTKTTKMAAVKGSRNKVRQPRRKGSGKLTYKARTYRDLA